MIGGNLGAAVQMLKVMNQQGGGQSWESYLEGKNLNLFVKENSRSGLVLTDSIAANNVTILPAYAKLSSNRAFCADNGGLDIGATDFTICGWVNSESTTKTSYRNLFGKLIAGNVAGRYGFYIAQTTGYISFYAQSSGGVKDIPSTIDLTTAGWVFLRADINQTSKVIRFFINEVQIGADVSYTGTFPALASQFEFMIGDGNNSTGSTYDVKYANASFSDIFVFNKLLSPSEITAIYTNRTIATGYKAYYPCLSAKNYIYDAGGTYHLTLYSVATNSEAFGDKGSRYGLDYGFRLYNTGLGDEYVPLKNDGTGIDLISTDAILLSTHNGNATNHNLSNSNLLFVGDEWDRSSTTYFEDLARLTEYGYLVASPKEWHISLINNLLLQSWGKTNHKAHNICKITNYSYKNRSILNAIVTSVDDLASDYNNIITNYCKETPFVDTYENDYIYWKESTDSVIAMNGVKQVKYVSAEDKIYLSLDDGVTWSMSIAVPGSNSNLQFGYIFDNGNILIGTITKLYLSTDNLATINEVIPKDIAGNNFTPTSTDNYLMTFVPCKATVGTKTVVAFSNYSINAATEYININVWYTTDSGVTVKSCYLANTTVAPASPLPAKHSHGIFFNPNNSKFWQFTGDGTDECNIIEGTYNDITDAWSWNKLYGDNDGGSTADTNKTFYKISGFHFIGDDVLWTSDSNDDNRRGIFKCAYTDFNNSANYVKILKTAAQCGYSHISGTEYIGSEMAYSRLITSKDLVSFVKSKIYTINANVLAGFITTFGIDSNGWFIVTIYETAESASDVFNGRVLKVKIK